MIMAKGFTDTDSLCRGIVRDAQNGIFKPVYLLMGDEPYYVDMVCDAILEHCLDESEKDFNQTVCYGADVTADAATTADAVAINILKSKKLCGYCWHLYRLPFSASMTLRRKQH